MLQAASLRALGGIRHGYCTRVGGVSEGIYASLNCGYGSFDNPAHVSENRARAMARLGLAGIPLCTVYQCHSARCVPVIETWPRDKAPRADAMVTDRPGLALGVLAADCAPVLLAETRAGVIGAAHAGWRGALGGVLEATVEAMVALGAEPARTIAAVGPCIGPQSYEVGDDLVAAFRNADEANLRYFTPAQSNGRHHFDLPNYTADRLAASGLATIAVLGRDTFAEAEWFFSYRRARLHSKNDYGRLLSAIAQAP